MTGELKKCCRCGERNPLDQFGKITRSKDGYRPYCKTCKYVEKVREKAIHKGAMVEPGIDGYIRMLIKNEQYCWYCGKPLNGNRHIDHIMPLYLGGTHSKDNLAVSCQNCNDSKGTESLMYRFLMEYGTSKERRNWIKIYRPEIEEWKMLREIIAMDLEQYFSEENAFLARWI